MFHCLPVSLFHLMLFEISFGVKTNTFTYLSIQCVQNAGTLQRLAASPVGSRVLQSCVKHGTAEQRKQILQELRTQLVDLAKSPYAYYVVCKLVDMGTKADLEGGRRSWCCLTYLQLQGAVTEV